MKKTIILILILLLVGASLTFAGCGDSDDDADTATTSTTMTDEPSMTGEADMGHQYTDITPAEAKQMIDENMNLTVIDVSPDYDEGHLPGAVNYPVGDGSLDEAIPALDKDKDYLVYCHVETASRKGAQKMVDAGFMNVYRLDGEYDAWVNAGYPIEQ